MMDVLLGRILVPDFFFPRPEDVHVGFMFWRMQRIRRFSGHRSALTLDVHHELCGLLADELRLSRPARIWARCHDLHKYAIGDLARPVKLALDMSILDVFFCSLGCGDCRASRHRHAQRDGIARGQPRE